MSTVPAGWRRTKIKDLAWEVRTRAEHGTSDAPVLSVTKHRGFVLSEEYFTKQVFSRDTSNYKVVHRGDFAYATIHLDEGSLGYLTDIDAGLVSPMYTVFQVDKGLVDPQYLFIQMKSNDLVREYGRLGEGTVNRRKSISFRTLGELSLSLPPLGEQRKIAAILTAVDEAIARTQAVIDQVQVVRKGLMKELLTKGIPGRHSRFKQTEIGKIPADWKVVSTASVLAHGPTNGRSPPSKSTPSGIPTFSIAAVRDGEVDVLGNLKYTDLPSVEGERFRLNKGDILIIRGNANPDLIGSCGIVSSFPNACIYPDILMRVVPSCAVTSRFFCEAWNAFPTRRQIQLKAKSSNGTFKINGGDVRSILLPLPPIEEQAEIDRLIEGIKTRIIHEGRSLEMLIRARSSLSTSLLTGKLRAAPDPDPATTPTP